MSRASPWALVFLLAACAHGGGEPAQVTIPQLPIPQRTEDLPATVTVAAGQERRLDIQIDTGLRAPDGAGRHRRPTRRKQ